MVGRIDCDEETVLEVLGVIYRFEGSEVYGADEGTDTG